MPLPGPPPAAFFGPRAPSPEPRLFRALGIESSCDETAIAVLEGDGTVRCNLVSSQVAAHAPYLGVVPELAARHRVPFVVAAPTTTFDLACPSGREIPIEQRDGEEVRRVRRTAVAPAAVAVYNPAFDVTPPELVTAIVSERGVARPVTAATVREIA